MNALISPCELYGTIAAPPSKSQAHRLLILSALADKPTKLTLSSISDDVRATINCLSALGAEFEQNGSVLTVFPIKNVKNGAVLDCCEGGSTLRFILPVAAALCAQCSFSAALALCKRPLSELLTAMEDNGARFSRRTLPFSLTGRLSGGCFRLPGNVSSQYVSGLLLALPLLERESEIEISGRLESAPYADMTLEALRCFGADCAKSPQGYRIKGSQHYISPQNVKPEGDWSAAAFFLTGGALCGDVSVSGLDSASKQGDRRILELLERFGAKVSFSGNTARAEKSKLHGCEIDFSDTPDLFPALAVAAAAAEGESRFTGIDRLRFKESDRVQAVIKMLRALGGNAALSGDSLVISGGALDSGRVESLGDHRLSMAAAVAACACKSGCEIVDAQCVSKSYPAFFEDFAALGGRISDR